MLVTSTLVTLLYAMATTIANVSLPQTQGALGATQDQIAWVVTFNIAATAVVSPMSARLRPLRQPGTLGVAHEP